MRLISTPYIDAVPLRRRHGHVLQTIQPGAPALSPTFSLNATKTGSHGHHPTRPHDVRVPRQGRPEVWPCPSSQHPPPGQRQRARPLHHAGDLEGKGVVLLAVSSHATHPLQPPELEQRKPAPPAGPQASSKDGRQDAAAPGSVPRDDRVSIEQLPGPVHSESEVRLLASIVAFDALESMVHLSMRTTCMPHARPCKSMK